MAHSRVVGFELSNERIGSVRLRDTRTGAEVTVEATEVVNAAGAWSGEVAALAGLSLDILYSKGTLVITQNRVTGRVVNRLRKPSNADIIVPGGTVSVLGTTSVRIADLADVAPSVEEVETILDETIALVPAIADTRIMRAYAGVRPLVRQGAAGDDRAVSRDLTLLDHGRDRIANFITITGGKLTTYRSMAEKAADLVCAHLGVTAPCRTHRESLGETSVWTVPGRAPATWLDQGDEADLLLCQCELVPASAVRQIASAMTSRPTLKEIGLRSRIGKGSCQGTFCSLRVLGQLYREGRTESSQGLDDLRSFLTERWKGERAVLFGTQLRQAELKEALHCALFGMEL
jgi:glycerol-3-phosphate dehydrogenase